MISKETYKWYDFIARKENNNNSIKYVYSYILNNTVPMWRNKTLMSTHAARQYTKIKAENINFTVYCSLNRGNFLDRLENLSLNENTNCYKVKYQALHYV